MSEPLLLKSEGDGIVRLSLNRPAKRNALTRELLAALRTHLRELAARPDVRLVVLGADGQAFCAGMDLAQMQETAEQANALESGLADTQGYRDCVATLFTLPMPTVAVMPVVFRTSRMIAMAITWEGWTGCPSARECSCASSS